MGGNSLEHAALGGTVGVAAILVSSLLRLAVAGIARNDPAASANTDTTPTAPLTWAERLQRVFAIDITQCPHCGGRLRVIADVTDPQLIERILEHLRAKPPPRAGPARAKKATSDNDLLSPA